MVSSVQAQYRKGVAEFFDHDTTERVIVGAQVVFKDDFIGGYQSIGTSGQAGAGTNGAPWTKLIQGTGSVAAVSAVPNGKVGCALTATSEKQEGTLYMDNQRAFRVDQGLVFEAVVTESVLPTGTAVSTIGVAGTYVDNPDAVARSCWFKINTGGTVYAECDDNVTDFSAATTLVLGTADVAELLIDMTDVTNIRFYGNGSDITPTGTTYAFAATGTDAAVQPWASTYKASGTGIATMQVDKIQLWQRRS